MHKTLTKSGFHILLSQIASTGAWLVVVLVPAHISLSTFLTRHPYDAALLGSFVFTIAQMTHGFRHLWFRSGLLFQEVRTILTLRCMLCLYELLQILPSRWVNLALRVRTGRVPYDYHECSRSGYINPRRWYIISVM